MGNTPPRRDPFPGGDGSALAFGALSVGDLDDGHFEWLVRELEAGRLQPPPESVIEGPAVSVSLGDACDMDPELLAAMCGPDGLGGQAALAAFGEGNAADALRPGPVLAALAAQVVTRVVPQPADSRIVSRPGSPPASPFDSRPAFLTDNELIGVLQATRRLANLVSWQQTMVIAEFARRRQAQFEAAKASGAPVGCRDGEFPGEELAMELVASGPYTSGRIDTAIELTTRLPRTLAGMEDGTIDLNRACAIASRTRSMTDADAAYADTILAGAAPGLRLDQLARKAEALEKKLAPEAVKARKELAKHLDQRVETRREESGNASLSGRELDTADVIASKAYIDALAAKLRNSGLLDGSIGRLRAQVLVDLTQGRNPLDRITPPPAARSGATSPDDEQATGCGEDDLPGQPGGGRSLDQQANGVACNDYASGQSANNSPGKKPEVNDDAFGTGSGGSPEPGNAFASRDDPAVDPSVGPCPASPRSGDPVPLPALINLLVPAGTLLGWGTAPAQAAGWGLLDAEETRALVQAAAQHPRTRWCMTIIAPDGTAVAHGCAAGQHPWPGNEPPPPRRSGNAHIPQPPDRTNDSSGPQQAAQLLDLLRRLSVTLEPIARDSCDHVHAEDRYAPSRKLKHLIHARAQTCAAPACNAQAVYSDLDHTLPYPDGLTDECNLTPKCRRHHRTKQAPGWKVAQPTPDTATWTTPSGRTHTATPTVYDLLEAGDRCPLAERY
jgi:Domain of unknown function (DUF222)